MSRVRDRNSSFFNKGLAKDITLAVIAFIDMDIDDQVFQFVTINRTPRKACRLHCITIFSSTFLRARTLERLRKIRRQTSPTNSDTTKIRATSSNRSRQIANIVLQRTGTDKNYRQLF